RPQPRRRGARGGAGWRGDGVGARRRVGGRPLPRFYLAALVRGHGASPGRWWAPAAAGVVAPVRSSLRAWGRWVATSLAATEMALVWVVARAPARPWTKAARRAASKGARPWHR